MSFLLDTDTCSAYLRGHRGVQAKMLQFSGRLHVSTITAAELYTWVNRAKSPASLKIVMDDLIAGVHVLDVTLEIALEFGRLRGHLLDHGKPPPIGDLLIAATALQHQMILVTHNVADFQNIPGLQMLDWLV